MARISSSEDKIRPYSFGRASVSPANFETAQLLLTAYRSGAWLWCAVRTLHGAHATVSPGFITTTLISGVSLSSSINSAGVPVSTGKVP